MTKQELALEVISRLKKEYPDADCTLDYDECLEASGERPSWQLNVQMPGSM